MSIFDPNDTKAQEGLVELFRKLKLLEKEHEATVIYCDDCIFCNEHYCSHLGIPVREYFYCADGVVNDKEDAE